MSRSSNRRRNRRRQDAIRLARHGYATDPLTLDCPACGAWAHRWCFEEDGTLTGHHHLDRIAAVAAVPFGRERVSTSKPTGGNRPTERAAHLPIKRTSRSTAP
jgi:hypothetical protein